MNHNFKEIERISELSKKLFVEHFPDINLEDTSQEIMLWHDGDFQIRTYSAYPEPEYNDEMFANVLYFNNKEGFSKHFLNMKTMDVFNEERVKIENNKKVVLIGASIPNLYLARLLRNRNYKLEIYEKNTNYINSQNRTLPNHFLYKIIGFDEFDDIDGKTTIELTKIKDKLADKLSIIYNAEIDINLTNEEIKLLNNNINFDFLVINTGHKQVLINSNKVFTYNYNVKNNFEHFAGNSLMSSIEKVEEIFNNILQNDNK